MEHADAPERSWGCSGDHSAYSDLWWVGILLDAAATLAGTAGKQLLRFAVITKNPMYYPLGLLCTAVVDPAFDISAYGFAAQSIIAPCAGMVVVWNVLLAPWTLGERLTRSRKMGGFLICLGTVGVGVFGNHTNCKRTVDEYLLLFVRPVACGYYLLFALWTLVCLHFFCSSSPAVSGFFMGAYGGALAGNMFTTKAVVEMFKCVTATSAHVVAATVADGAALVPGVSVAPPLAPPASECSSNPFFGPYPYIFIFISLALACASLYLLAVCLRTFEVCLLRRTFCEPFSCLEVFSLLRTARFGLVPCGIDCTPLFYSESDHTGRSRR